MPAWKIDIKKADRLLLALGILVLASALFVVLTRQTGDSADPAPLPFENRTLVFTQWWQNEMDENTLPNLIAEFERINPDIKVKLDTRPYLEIRDRLIYPDKDARWEGPAPDPDILGIDPRWLKDLKDAGSLESLESYLHREEENTELRSLMASAEEDFYGDSALPLVSFMTPLFYHIEALKAAGFDRPPKNWREFLAYARASADPEEGRYGFAVSLSARDPNGISRDIFSWIWSSGASLARNGKLEFDVPYVREALSLLNQLYQEGIMVKDPFQKTGKDRLREFASGQVGMMIGSVSDIPVIQQSGLNFGIAIVPSPESYGGKPRFGHSAWYAGISGESKRKEDAWKFLRFLYSQASIIGAGAGAGRLSSGDPLYAKVGDINAGGEAARDFYNLPRMDILERILREELRLMFDGRQTSEETARTTQRRWDYAQNQ